MCLKRNSRLKTLWEGNTIRTANVSLSPFAFIRGVYTNTSYVIRLDGEQAINTFVSTVEAQTSNTVQNLK